MDLQLKNKVVLVTGGAKGIGASISTVFAREGAKVAIVTRDSADSRAFADELSKTSDVFYFPADLSDPELCRLAVEAVVTRFGGVDIVVNNAGVNDGASLEAGVAKFEASLRANLIHLYAIVHHALPYLKKAKGNIVNIGSKVAETGQGGTSGYAASKGAMNALTREWAVDLAPFGIRANTVSVAECMTPLYKTWLNTLPDPETTLIAIERNIPLGRRMTLAEEIADAVVFTASPRAAHTTGQILYVDGGYTHLDRSCTVGK